jgi:hypothetical protein
MLRQDQAFGERAAFRWADQTRIARSFLALLAGALVGAFSKSWSKHRTGWEVFSVVLAAQVVGFLIAHFGS